MESESTPREYVVLPSRVLSIPIGLWPLESVVHASYKYYLAWLLSISNHSNEIENAALVYR